MENTGALNTELFENSDYNPIISNAIENRDSSIRQVSDRNQVTTSPANIQALLSGSADAAQIPDSNYTSVGITNSRYEGSKTSAETFNSIEPMSKSVFSYVTENSFSWIKTYHSFK